MPSEKLYQFAATVKHFNGLLEFLGKSELPSNIQYYIWELETSG